MDKDSISTRDVQELRKDAPELRRASHLKRVFALGNATHTPSVAPPWEFQSVAEAHPVNVQSANRVGRFEVPPF